MTIQYPTNLDSLSNPSSGDALNSPNHADQHANANDAIEALEAKVGVDSSAVTTSHDYKLSEVTDKAVGKTATQTLTNKTLTSPIINLSSNATGDIYYRASDGTLARLPIGTTGNILDVSAGGVPEWVANPSGTDASTSTKGVVKLDTAPASATDPIAVGTNSGKFTYGIGAYDNALVKTYFNIQLPFTLWTGAVVNDTTTTFVNWVRTSTDIGVAPMGSLIDVTGTAGDDITLDWGKSLYTFSSTNIVIVDFWAKLPASGTGDINMGFGQNNLPFQTAYNYTSTNKVAFCQKGTGELYATIAKDGVGVTNTDISSGLTLTNWNNYRIELDLANEAKFYVNGVLKATLSGTNFPNGAVVPSLGFGRSNTSLFKVTAPTLSLQMNP